jgi:hypothetical protein
MFSYSHKVILSPGGDEKVSGSIDLTGRPCQARKDSAETEIID